MPNEFKVVVVLAGQKVELKVDSNDGFKKC
jgi:hypothetical protein